jgi:hypothetical protein
VFPLSHRRFVRTSASALLASKVVTISNTRAHNSHAPHRARLGDIEIWTLHSDSWRLGASAPPCQRASGRRHRRPHAGARCTSWWLMSNAVSSTSENGCDAGGGSRRRIYGGILPSLRNPATQLCARQSTAARIAREQKGLIQRLAHECADKTAGSCAAACQCCQPAAARGPVWPSRPDTRSYSSPVHAASECHC